MSLHIVGGIYQEKSVFPPDDVIYGSGGRAAYALKELDSKVKLTSYLGTNQKEAIEYHVNKLWNMDFSCSPSPELISFSYYHGLSTPIIRPVRLPFRSVKDIYVEDTSILLFGMLEGNASVHGKRVVYDPQSPEQPQKFSDTGSTAEELAYVLNLGESRLLTGCNNPDDAAKSLFDNDGADVVVIKCGTDGARIYTNEEVSIISAYVTERIWPIGSGDIFAAVFAYYWAVKNLEPAESAHFASKGAALYCNSRVLPLLENDLLASPFPFNEFRPKRTPNNAWIYLAGPFFTMGQLWLVEEALNALKHAGFNVFSPFHDVGIGSADDVVPLDIEGIEKADAVLALCDGLDPGTLFEVGYAVKKGIPVVAFGEHTSTESMKMLSGTGCKVFKDFTSAIYHVQWEARN